MLGLTLIVQGCEVLVILAHKHCTQAGRFGEVICVGLSAYALFGR